jgi:hypothetical protein
VDKKISRKLMFNDGYIYSSELILLASQLQEFANYDDSRIAQIIKGEWKYRDFELDAILSVTASALSKEGFFMGRNGNILVAASGYTTETIDDVAKYGELIRIRNIADTIYAVGTQGQVYRREEGEWIHMDQGILGIEHLHLEDIGGTAPSDLYVVGPYGDVWHFNGNKWSQSLFPTNRPLSGIKAVSHDEVYVCGDNGGLYVGNHDGWKYIGNDDITYNFWAVEVFKGKVYVSYNGGILVYDGNELQDVDFKLGHPIGCHRMHANDGVLWSFGIDDLVCFDGTSWSEVVCPMNAG